MEPQLQVVTEEETGTPNPLNISVLRDLLLQEESKTRYAQKNNLALGPITGFPLLDTALGGYLVPGLHALLARPGAGKTAFLLQVAQQCKTPCLFVTAEMSPIDLMRRIAARVNNIPHSKFRGANCPENTLENSLTKVVSDCERLRIYDSTIVPGSMQDIIVAASSLREEYNPGGDEHNPNHVLIILDSLTDWAYSFKGNGSEYDATEASLTSLKLISSSLQCPILFIVHQNRTGNNDKGDDSLFKGKGTGRIEYMSETVLSLKDSNEAAPFKDRIDANGMNTIEMKLAKNRHGIRDEKIVFSFKGETMTFKEKPKAITG